MISRLSILIVMITTLDLSPESALGADPGGEATGVVLTADEDGFAIRSSDEAFRLGFRSLVQMDVRIFPEDGEMPGNDGFLIRRARLELQGHLSRIFGFRLMPDFGGASPSLLDAWLRVKVGGDLQIQAGRAKLPVGLERGQAREHSLFTELGYPTALLPNRDIGLGVRGKWVDGRLSYEAGLGNGVPDGGSSTGDSDDGKELWGRLFLTKLDENAAIQGLGVGVAGTYGTAVGRIPSDYRTVGQRIFFRWRRPSEASTGVKTDGRVWRVVPQVYWHSGPFGLLAEYVASSQDIRVAGTAEKVTNAAYLVSASWVVGGENRGFQGIRPNRPLGDGTGGSGAWQVLARYTALHIDDDAFPAFADPVTSAKSARTGTVGLTWYATAQVRFVTDYSLTSFASAGPLSFPDEHVVIARTQYRF